MRSARLLLSFVWTLACAGCIYDGLGRPNPQDCTATPCDPGFQCNSSTLLCEPIPPAPELLGQCTTHDQCDSKVCDLLNLTYVGTCAATGGVIYVYNRDGACTSDDATRLGTLAAPFCTLQRAFQEIKGSGGKKTLIRLLPSKAPYPPGGDVSGPVRIYGGGVSGFPAPVATTSLAPPQGGGTTLNVTGGAVLVDGVEVQAAASSMIDQTIPAVQCAGGATLSLLRSVVRPVSTGLGDHLTGVLAADCKLIADRDLFSSLSDTGIDLEGAGPHRLSNDFVVDGRGTGVRLGMSAAVTFEFNTVAGNAGNSRQGNVPGGAVCLGGQVVRDSIIYLNGQSTAMGGRTEIGGCGIARVVADKSETRTGVVIAMLSFVDATNDDYRLTTNATANAAVLNTAADVQDVATDYFGTSRPQGGKNDIGAHQLH